ncbi:MAG: right-handed parallel beta-helix repeat-containing protein [Methanobrevibacter sp.]|nr:right-handed parallel beta-helix repeat-containing protein [Methanobrevibacter sp.]
MNKKILLIATLVIVTIVSLGSISASEDVSAIDDSGISAVDDVVLSEGEGETPEPTTTTINIDNSMTNEEIQAKLDAELQDNTEINFAPGEYSDVNLKITKDKVVEVDDVDEEGNPIKKNVTEKTTLNNIIINGNGATLTGRPPMSNYYDGIFEVANVNGFTLSGFNFICQGVTQANMKTPSCLIIFNTTNGIVENNNISGGRFGIYLGSKFTNPNYDAIVRYNTVTGVSDMGIISFGSARSHIYNNTVINPKNHGIDVRHGSGPNCIVENNTVIGAREGIYLMHSAGHKAINNTLNNCDVGITCYGSSNIFCDENKFINQTKIGFLLASGYTNITIGENNDYSGLVFVPMPPTFTYNIVKANSDYVSLTSGTFSQTEATNTTYVQVYFTVGDAETLDPVDLKADTTNIITDALLELNNNITVKIWRNDDNNHIDAGELINVTIDGVDYSAESDITGAVYVDITGLKEGKHYMTVKYPGYNGLKESTWSAILQIGNDGGETQTLTATSITASAITATAKISKTLSVSLKDADGKAIANKKITYSVNGITKTATTDANGVAKITVNRVSGTYYYSLCFLGDDDYKASFKTVKVTVKKQAVKASFAKATLKVKKAKKVKFTLKDSKGKAISGKKITIKVNGKTFSAKTNSKGVASIKVKVAKKGKFTATAKFAGDNTYKAISKKAKFTVK